MHRRIHSLHNLNSSFYRSCTAHSKRKPSINGLNYTTQPTQSPTTLSQYDSVALVYTPSKYSSDSEDGKSCLDEALRFVEAHFNFADDMAMLRDAAPKAYEQTVKRNALVGTRVF